MPETALTCPMFSATRAITAGMASSANVTENDGRCHPTASRLPSWAWLPSSPSAVWLGNPSHSALLTSAQSTRSWAIASPPDDGVTDVIWPNTWSASHDTTYPKIRPRKIAIRPAKPRSPTAIRITASMVSNPIHGSAGR